MISGIALECYFCEHANPRIPFPACSRDYAIFDNFNTIKCSSNENACYISYEQIGGGFNLWKSFEYFTKYLTFESVTLPPVKLVFRGCGKSTKNSHEEYCEKNPKEKTETCYCFSDTCNSGIPFDYESLEILMARIVLVSSVAVIIFLVYILISQWSLLTKFVTEERKSPGNNHFWTIHWLGGHCDFCHNKIWFGALVCKKCQASCHENCSGKAPSKCDKEL